MSRFIWGPNAQPVPVNSFTAPNVLPAFSKFTMTTGTDIELPAPFLLQRSQPTNFTLGGLFKNSAILAERNES